MALSEAQVEVFAAMRNMLDHHNATCPLPATEVLVHPADYAQLACRRAWGITVRADERVKRGRCRIACEGSAWLAEEFLLLAD